VSNALCFADWFNCSRMQRIQKPSVIGNAESPLFEKGCVSAKISRSTGLDLKTVCKGLRMHDEEFQGHLSSTWLVADRS